MSELPLNWVRSDVGSVLRIEYGKGLTERVRDSTGRVPVYGSAGRVGYHSASIVDGPTIVIGRKGGAGATYLELGPCWPIDTTYFSRVPRGLCPAFIAYQLQSMQLRSLDSSTAVPSLRREDLEAQELAIAPTAEQERIVAAIEEQLSRLDAGLEALERVQEKLNRMRASMLQAASTGRLLRPTDDRVELDQLLSALATHEGAKRVQRLSREPITRTIPKSWEWVPFADLTISLDAKRVPVKASDRAQRQGVYPYYGAQGVIDHVDDYLFDGEHLLIAEDGANLLSRTQPIAFVVRGQFWVNNHAHVVQPKEGVSSQYLALAVNSDPLRGFITGTAQPKLTAAALNGLMIALPSITEQLQIVDETNRQFSLMSALESAAVSNIERGRSLRSSVLTSAFSGKLVPQDPADEPASALLERIAADRESSNGHKSPRTRGTRALRKRVTA